MNGVVSCRQCVVGINYTKFKDMLANYLREHGNSAAKYETACVGTSKAPNRFVSSIEIDGVIFGSLREC